MKADEKHRLADLFSVARVARRLLLNEAEAWRLGGDSKKAEPLEKHAELMGKVLEDLAPTNRKD